MSNTQDETTLTCIRISSDPQPFVRIVVSETEEYLFPYGHLLSVKWEKVENMDVIHMFFAAHDVACAGQRLREILPPLRRTNVTSIQLSEKPPGTDGPWVREVEVHVRQSEEG